MRTSRTLLALAAIGLLVAAAAPAIAQAPPPQTPGGGGGAAGQDAAAKGAERQQAAQERVAALQAARQAILDGFKANRSAILSEYLATLNATRERFLAEKANVLAACNETRAQSTNASETQEAPDHATCVSDGLRPLIEEARAANAAARELALSKLQEERAKGMQSWAQTLRAENERYQARTGQPAGA
ncbi:MAG TPA: hypothetical protein VFH78_14360 [Candidatus Thermoplasmatota archaeon]|nr:hypothetical protein [Candidatus Thermoplasmatota archaeon]